MVKCQIIQVAEADKEIGDTVQKVIKKSTQFEVRVETKKKGTDQDKMKCDQCNFICKKEITLQKHINTKHPRSNTVPVRDFEVGKFSYTFGLRH